MEGSVVSEKRPPVRRSTHRLGPAQGAPWGGRGGRKIPTKQLVTKNVLSDVVVKGGPEVRV